MTKTDTTGPPPSIQRDHELFLYPAVRITASGPGGSAVGSGVVVWSDGKKSYILTNHHVVSPLINIERGWDAVAGRELKKEDRLPAQVEFMQYENLSRINSVTAQKAHIVGWNEAMDLALLELNAGCNKIATLMPVEDYQNNIFTRTPVVTVGCGLGVPPFATDGTVASVEHFEIEGYPYLMVTAPSIFGNSGGPVFDREAGQILGLTARISLSFAGFASQAVTHMNWIIPVQTINQFLEEQIYDFIVNPKRTPEQCETERKKIREQSLKSQRLGVPDEDED